MRLAETDCKPDYHHYPTLAPATPSPCASVSLVTIPADVLNWWLCNNTSRFIFDTILGLHNQLVLSLDDHSCRCVIHEYCQYLYISLDANPAAGVNMISQDCFEEHSHDLIEFSWLKTFLLLAANVTTVWWCLCACLCSFNCTISKLSHEPLNGEQKKRRWL